MKVGDVIDGKYTVIRLMGEGGMGAVYEVRHEVIGGRFALKCLHAQHATNEVTVQRFIQEAKSASAIGSEHIVLVTDGGRAEDGSPYLVMEYLEGQDLEEVLEREGRQEPGRALSWICQVCEALAPVHDRGIVHRDLKPANLFLTHREGVGEWVKILDFGIAKVHPDVSGLSKSLTKSDDVFGTPFYMAPEQLTKAKTVDHRADIYSCGVILYELLSNHLPFEAKTAFELFSKILTESPRPLSEVLPNVDPALEQLVMRAISRNVALRHQITSDLALKLNQLHIALEETTPIGHEAIAPILLGRNERSTPQPKSGSDRADMIPQTVVDAQQPSYDPQKHIKTVVGVLNRPHRFEEPSTKPSRRAPSKPSSSIRLALIVTGALVITVVSALVLPSVLVNENVSSYEDPVIEDVGQNLIGRTPGLELQNPIRMDSESGEVFERQGISKVNGVNSGPPSSTDEDGGSRNEEVITSHGNSTGSLPDRKRPSRALDNSQNQRPATPLHVSEKLGYLTVFSAPSSKVYLDGRFIGNSPIAKREVPAGMHTVKLVCNGDYRYSKTVRVRTNNGEHERIRRGDVCVRTTGGRLRIGKEIQ